MKNYTKINIILILILIAILFAGLWVNSYLSDREHYKVNAYLKKQNIELKNKKSPLDKIKEQIDNTNTDIEINRYKRRKIQEQIDNLLIEKSKLIEDVEQMKNEKEELREQAGELMGLN